MQLIPELDTVHVKCDFQTFFVFQIFQNKDLGNSIQLLL